MAEQTQQTTKSSQSLIQRIVNQAVKTDWTLTDDFELYFYNPKISLDSFVVTAGEESLSILKSIVSVDIPQLSSAEMDEVSGGERRIGVKMYESFRFTVKFRDYDALSLRRYFEAIWIAQQYEYFDDIKSTVFVENKGINVFNTTDALITGISSIQFDNTSTQIAEFDVSFISNTLSDATIDMFGSHVFDRKFTDSLDKRKN